MTYFREHCVTTDGISGVLIADMLDACESFMRLDMEDDSEETEFEDAYAAATESTDAAGFPAHDADWQVARDDGELSAWRIEQEKFASIALRACGYSDSTAFCDGIETLADGIHHTNENQHGGDGTWFEIFCSIHFG